MLSEKTKGDVCQTNNDKLIMPDLLSPEFDVKDDNYWVYTSGLNIRSYIGKRSGLHVMACISQQPLTVLDEHLDEMFKAAFGKFQGLGIKQRRVSRIYEIEELEK